jgi:hypothetical protein
LAATMLVSAPVFGQDAWITMQNETATRLNVTPLLGSTDPDEKDYAVGDLDQDGDDDLVCVRKQPFTSPGARRNVLFMNENGVLTDRTTQYASASDIPGDQGFLTPTNDRDVLLVDVNNDTWLDIVTATTISDGQPKHIGHPRIYINLGEVAGVWQGFRYEDARIPQLLVSGQPQNPRFCSVAAGDVTGDGRVDLFFGDYDSSGAGGSGEPPGIDMNDRLLINNGSGFFTDQSTARMNTDTLLSAFSAAAAIVDINGDGVRDVLKDTALNFPQEVRVAYNDPANVGSFMTGLIGNPVTIYNLSAYFISVGDLNGDGDLDVVVTDDGQDRYLLNSGNDALGRATFLSRTFQFQSGTGSDDGFGGGSRIADMNNDGWPDVLIADVDVDISGCNRRLHIYRNLGNAPTVTLQDQFPSPIPFSQLQGTYDVAVIDINSDGWNDLVVGRCSGTAVYINQPPGGLAFVFPDGVPGFVNSGSTTTFPVEVNGIGTAIPEPGSATINYSVEGGPFTQEFMTPLGGNLYEASLPAVDCPGTISFYFSAETTLGQTFSDPPSAPVGTYTAIAAAGTEVSLRDEIEGSVAAWATSAAGGTTGGQWEAADPNGTLFNNLLCAPEDDATAGVGVMAFVTQNGPQGASVGSYDVDNGPVQLISPVVDIDGTDATISYSRWFFCTDHPSFPAEEDFFLVEVSNNGGASWVTVENIPHVGPQWVTTSFVVSDYVVPTATVRVRFSTQDLPNNSFTEAGVDNFQVEEFVCVLPCPADIVNDDNLVDVSDLLALLSAWGTNDPAADVDESGLVDVTDLLIVLSAWGPCP